MTEITSGDGSADADSEVSTNYVELPARIVDQVERRVEGTDFASPAEYITFVLEETIQRVEEREQAGDDEGEEVTEEQVRSRLESLGYLE